jgi:hypothetical protein
MEDPIHPPTGARPDPCNRGTRPASTARTWWWRDHSCCAKTYGRSRRRVNSGRRSPWPARPNLVRRSRTRFASFFPWAPLGSNLVRLRRTRFASFSGRATRRARQGERPGRRAEVAEAGPAQRRPRVGGDPDAGSDGAVHRAPHLSDASAGVVHEGGDELQQDDVKRPVVERHLLSGARWTSAPGTAARACSTNGCDGSTPATRSGPSRRASSARRALGPHSTSRARRPAASAWRADSAAP